MGNGMCERFNRTILDTLWSLESHQKQNWKAYLGAMIHSYNCTRHESTGQTPYLLMLGRNPRLPIDVTLGLHVKEQQPSSKCISNLKDRLSQAYHLATEAAQKAREKQKEGYDIRIRVKVVSFDGKHKLADRWEQDPYIVVSQPNTDIPVYNLRKENNEGRARTLHRNLLLPIGYIRDVPTPAPRKLLKRPPIPAKRTIRQKIKELEHPHTDDHTTEISSDDESEHGYIIISQEEPVYSDSTITDEPLVQQTDEILNADDEDTHPLTDTVDSAD
jgi:hypothetical protein